MHAALFTLPVFVQELTQAPPGTVEPARVTQLQAA
jgi:hypothetical protein